MLRRHAHMCRVHPSHVPDAAEPALTPPCGAIRHADARAPRRRVGLRRMRRRSHGGGARGGRGCGRGAAGAARVPVQRRRGDRAAGVAWCAAYRVRAPPYAGDARCAAWRPWAWSAPPARLRPLGARSRVVAAHRRHLGARLLGRSALGAHPSTHSFLTRSAQAAPGRRGAWRVTPFGVLPFYAFHA
jgi:hypothetical protein